MSIQSVEKLVVMLLAKLERQRRALEATESQLAAAQRVLDSSPK